MKVNGKISKGHGIASGKTQDIRYPKGTLSEQLPYFKEGGLDLSGYYLGTINLDISPYQYKIGEPKFFFEAIPWSEHIPPENFYFLDVTLFFRKEAYTGLIYMPDPDTKIDHIQENSVLELIMPRISGLSYGMQVYIDISDKQLQLFIP